jgi:hypothetical protein
MCAGWDSSTGALGERELERSGCPWPWMGIRGARLRVRFALFRQWGAPGAHAAGSAVARGDYLARASVAQCAGWAPPAGPGRRRVVVTDWVGLLELSIRNKSTRTPRRHRARG